MLLTLGTRLGRYEIQSVLGTGGMGEVYRGHDTTLNRDVALKVIPALFAADPDRLARFKREAQVLASLNHPHIAAIYGFEDSGAVHALVLELVEGETLAERIARGRDAPSLSEHQRAGRARAASERGLPIPEALAVARQIAEALEAADEHSIVHRDLKPVNIKITPAGVVKVLDFGLAKAVSGDGSGPGLAQSPTMSIGSTREGAVLGTAAYMSPEQARGLTVDKRTDIWAFGCVLYEMLAGRAPFAGDTIPDTIARALEREPDWSALPAKTPATVRRLLTRCLDKDLRRRLQDIGDARIEIEDVLSGAALTPAETAVVDQSPVRLAWSIAAVASLVAVIATGALTWHVRAARHARAAPPRISRLTMASSGAEAVAVSGRRSLAITPDGTRVIYVGSGNQLFVRPLDRLDATAIFTGAAPVNFVFVSPDGQWVGFVEGNAIRKVALTGGPAATITMTDPPFGATWAPGDTIVFATSDPATGLRRVSAGGGDVSEITQPAPARGELDHLWPEMLPGGRAVLFTIAATTGGLPAAQVAVLDLATGKYAVLVRGGSHAHYVPSGHLVYTAEGTLRAVPFDLNGLETRGTPVTVLPRLVTTPEGAGAFVVAADGTLAYVDAPGAVAAAARTLVWVDRQGREEPLAAPARPYFHPRLSPDGARVAVAIADQTNDIWVWDLARRTLSQLTFDPAGDFAPVWTPDGRRLIFFSQREGRLDGPAPDASARDRSRGALFWQLTDGTGGAERLGVGFAPPPSGVTPDGMQVIFGVADLMMLALYDTRPSSGSGRGGPVEPRRVQPLLQTPSIERNGVISPDGRWLAYESDSTGRFEIYVRPFPNTSAGQWLISPSGGTRPLWARNGLELFYVAPGGALMAVQAAPRGGAWSAGSPAKVLEGPYATEGVRDRRTYDVSPDGRRFLMVKQAPANQDAAPQIVVVQHWVEELKRLPARAP